MKQVKAPIISTVEAMPETHLVWLEAPDIAGEASPGQFVMAACGDDTFLPRPFSVHRVDGGQLALLFKVVGKGTRWLSQLKRGETLDIFGPLGNGFTVNAGARNLLLVGGGMGIAPLCFLADCATGEGNKVTIIQGGRSCDCLLPVTPQQKSYEGGMLPADFQCINATEDGSEGFKGMATQLIPHYLEGVDQVFACGPVAMYRTMAQMRELKGRDVQISLEIMMGCGTGVCYGCTIKTKKGLKQICKDGPVFGMEEVEWGEGEVASFK